MDIIPITPEHSIEYDPTQWRLVADQEQGKSLLTLVEADAQNLKFHPQFAAQQHLALSEIPANAVSQVVVGWIPEQSAWQLGLFLTNGTVENMTWCALAVWDQTQPRGEQAAKHAGKALSQLINSPLHTVERHTSSEGGFGVEQATQPAVSTIPIQTQVVSLAPLPLIMGDWLLRHSGEGLIWQVTRSWVNRHIWRVVFFMVVLLIFIFLAIGSLQSGLAPVTPEWLPYVGFGIALVLLFSALENLWKIIARRQVVIDNLAQEVRSERILTGLVDWRIPFERLELILVSQGVARPQGRRTREDPMHIAQDTWIHLSDGENFFLVCEQDNTEGKAWRWEVVRRRAASKERYPLDLTEYDTPVHHAVQHLAQQLNIPVFVDIR